MKKDDFKEFVKKHPNLITYVKNNEMTWQKFYEMYDLYGEDESIWKDYIGLKEENKINNTTEKVALGGLTLTEFINFIKKVDLDSLQEGISNVQRVLGVVQDFSKKYNKSEQTSTYKPRPLYRHFED